MRRSSTGRGRSGGKKWRSARDGLGNLQKGLNRLEAGQRSATNLAILILSFAMLFLLIAQKQAGMVSLTGLLVGTIAMMGSFGPVTALGKPVQQSEPDPGQR